MRTKFTPEQLDSIFGGSEMILLMLEAEDVVNDSTLKRLEDIKNELNEIEGVERCISPFDAQEISVVDGFIQMDPFMEDIPSDPSGYELLKTRIIDNGMASRFFYTDDFSLVSLILIKDSRYPDKELITEINRVIEDNPGPGEVLMGGALYPVFHFREYQEGHDYPAASCAFTHGDHVVFLLQGVERCLYAFSGCHHEHDPVFWCHGAVGMADITHHHIVAHHADCHCQ